MKNESELKSELVKQFRRLGHYARRVEDKFTVGFPDVVLIPRGYPVFFVEAKIVRSSTFGPTERQFVELARLDISPQHSVPCILGFDNGEVYLHQYVRRAKISECVVKRHDEELDAFFIRFYTERITQ